MMEFILVFPLLLCSTYLSFNVLAILCDKYIKYSGMDGSSALALLLPIGIISITFGFYVTNAIINWMSTYRWVITFNVTRA
jgi:hypothetical protein